MTKFFQLWLPVLLWMVFIFILSGIPGLKTELEFDFTLRKAAHIAEYFILTLLLYRAFRGSFELSYFTLVVCPAAIALLYAISDEYHQIFVHGRNGSVVDVLIDSIGIILFYMILKCKKRFK